MKKSESFLATTFIVLVILIVLISPISGLVSISTSPSPSKTDSSVPDAIGVATPSYYVTASVTSGSPVVGDPVTIFGTAVGDTPPSMVQIWVFAGNYVNVSNVPVNAAGGFSKTYSTTGLTPATYYVFIESPGPNSDFNLDLAEAGIFSGQVVNTATNALIFNLTGAGSVKDANASLALSEAFNEPGIDDVYTKLTFQLTATGTSPGGTTPVTASTTPARSPLGWETTVLVLVMGGLSITMYGRKKK